MHVVSYIVVSYILECRVTSTMHTDTQDWLDVAAQDAMTTVLAASGMHAEPCSMHVARYIPVLYPVHAPKHQE